ncbi:MAG: hypothetical protein SGARI_002769 [Bacillariaceae sp.]
MGKKKQPFIDKKKSSTYHILYRSQRDVTADNNDGGDSQVVLWPSPDNNKATDQQLLLGDNQAIQLKDETLSDWKSELSKAGLVDDFDYEKHLKPITGSGQYLQNNTTGARSQKQVGMSVQDEIVKEVDRQLDSIALTADCMDEEIAQALFGDFEEGEFEELNDEFILDAAQEPQDKEESDGFDFAAHVQRLMEKAKMESQGDETGQLATIHELGRQDHAFFSQAKSIGKGCDDDDSGFFNEHDLHIEGTPGIVPKLTVEEEQALCDKFNATLAEYDSDELGEGCDDEYDDESNGNFAAVDRPLEGDAQVEAALDDFLKEKQDDIFIKGTRHYMEGHRNGGSSFAALVGTKMVPVKDITEAPPSNSNTGIHDMTAILGEADETLADPLHAPPAEEIFIDGKSYFSEKIRNPWDCESILSTYSNLDNNPVTIGGSGGRRRKKKNSKKGGRSGDESSSVADVHQIQLSLKTGLPVGVLSESKFKDDDGYDYDEVNDDTYVSVNKGEARRKNETAEEKRLRKLTIKKERQLARMQKKIMKEAYNDEFGKRQDQILGDDVGGKSIFRF